MAYFLGIDLGTTYTAAATTRGGRTEIAALTDRASMVPSVLFLKDDDSVLVGDAANRRGLREPERVAREFKRRFGDSAPLILGGVPYGADLLTARLLRWVVDRVTEREGDRPERIALSHPANWGSYKLDLLHQAVRRADLDQLTTCETISEPVAAATWYATHQRVEPGQVVAVYDLGGGTFDAAVLRRTDDGFALLGPAEGIERLGGIDFDAAVFAHVTGALGAAWDDLDPERPAAQAAVAGLRRECVEAKEALSSDTQVSIPVVLPGVHTEVRLTRAELEAMVRPALSETVSVLRRALRGAGVEATEVAKVLLVGGSSRMPLVGEVVSASLGRPIAVDAHPKNAVALGAAVAAATVAPPSAPAAATTVIPVLPATALADTGRTDGAVTALADAGRTDGATVAHASPSRTTPAAPPNAIDPSPGGSARSTRGQADPRPPVVVPAPAGPPPTAASRAPVAASAQRPAPSRRSAAPAPARPSHRPPPARTGTDRRLVAALAALVLAAAVVAAILVVRTDDDTAGPGTDGSATTEAPTTTSEVDPGLDADGDGMLDRPGAPPDHAEPPPALVAPEVASLNQAVHEGFERVSIRFTGDLPPTAELVPMPERGLLRIWFPENSPTGGTDDAAISQVFEGTDLGLAAFLVVDQEGQAFVDIHAPGPVTAEHFRLVTEDGQPVIAVDVQSADGPWTPSSINARGGVLLDPVAGSSLPATGSFLVEGYSRLAGNEGVVEVYDNASGVVVGSQAIPLPGEGAANGFFSFDLEPSAPLAPGDYEIRLTGPAIEGGPPAMVQTTATVE